MFSKVAITVLLFTLLLPWFTSAMGAFEHCPSCDKKSCPLSAQECRHGKKHGMKMDKSGHKEHKSGNVNDSSVFGKERKQGEAECVIKADCAGKSGRLTIKSAEPHLITVHNISLSCLKFLSGTFFEITEFKDPYPFVIDRPPASLPFYS